MSKLTNVVPKQAPLLVCVGEAVISFRIKELIPLILFFLHGNLLFNFSIKLTFVTELHQNVRYICHSYLQVMVFSLGKTTPMDILPGKRPSKCGMMKSMIMSMEDQIKTSTTVY